MFFYQTPNIKPQTIKRYDLSTNELSYAVPILFQPVPEHNPQIQVIEGNLYLIGIFSNSKYSVFRTELEEVQKMFPEPEIEEAKSRSIIRSIPELFNNPTCSDRILQVEGKDIPVHKEILVLFFSVCQIITKTRPG